MKRLLEHAPLLSKASAETILWLVFAVSFLLLLFIDLLWMSKSKPQNKTRHVRLAVVTVIFGLLYGVFICLLLNHQQGFDFFSAYITEYSLSIDNLFAFALIFQYFKLNGQQQSKVLLWGVLGAMFFRFVFVFIGAELIEQFEWLLYVLALLLFWSGVKMLMRKEHTDFNPQKSWVQKYLLRFLPISYNTSASSFFIRENRKLKLSYLFVALIFVELTDILFAIDSLPAAFGITRNKELILTSNILAVMGLRSLFFVLNDFLQKFQYLQKAVPLILIFISGKMTAELFGYKMNSIYSFLVILMLLAGAVVLSIMHQKKTESSNVTKKVSYENI